MVDILLQAPGLAVAAFIVVKFLNYIKARNCSLENILKENNKTTSELNRVLRDNSKIMGEVIQTVNHCERVRLGLEKARQS